MLQVWPSTKTRFDAIPHSSTGSSRQTISIAACQLGGKAMRGMEEAVGGEIGYRKVRVVCRTDELDWILGKIARQLVRELEPLVEVSLGPAADAAADMNHYVWYDDYRDGSERATIGITHIDSPGKF